MIEDRQLNTEIRKLVLTTLAGIDLKGDLRIAAPLPKELGPRTDGIWIDQVPQIQIK